ncbi:hypothetical protein QYF36_016046 [Acer negundo]|nr:hypothetical protein QYF36_016046 [Acer negundo]
MSTAPKNVNIVITAPRLKFFNLNEVDSVVLSMVDCPALENVDIHNSQPVCIEADDKKKTYILDLFDMVEGFFHVKSLRISLDLPTEKFILYLYDVDAETKIAVLNKETRVEELVGSTTISEEIQNPLMKLKAWETIQGVC